MSDIILRIKNVSKHFGPTQALKNISLDIKRGTIHSLVGRNGAGKSTLVNIIAGIHIQDNGNVFLDETEITHNTIFERQKIGIRMVTQHASVVPYLTVAENIFLGLWPFNKLKMVDWKAAYAAAEKELKDYGLDIDPKSLVANLDQIAQRKVNIIRSLYGGGKLIILDEPTTSLSSEDRENLFSFVKELTKKGTTFIYISHYLEEVIKLSDEISVIRDGMAYTGYTSEKVNVQKLASLVAGEDVVLTQREKEEQADPDDVVIECKNICAENLNDVSLQIRKGEIIGFIGFPGSGAQELCRTLYGLLEQKSGSILVKNKLTGITNPTNALENGIVYIPHDRHKEGIVDILTIRENISLPILKNKLTGKSVFLKKLKEKDTTNKCIRLLNVKANSMEDKLSSLSGGNQQKVVVAKALACEPLCLILDEPTVGIDIKSREEILTILNDMTKTGMAAIYLTNDYEELIRMSDKLVFFDKGRITKIIDNSGLKAEDIITIRDTKKDGAYGYEY